MAKRLRTDDIQLNITINSNKAKLELGELDRRAVKLREEMKGLKKGTEEYAAKSRELSQVKNRMDELRKEVGLTALSMRQLNDRARELRQMRQHLTPGTQEFKKVDTELNSINARLKELRTGGQQAGRSLAQSAGSIKTAWVGIAAAIYGAFRGVTRLMQAYDKRAKANETLLFALNQEEAIQRRLIRLASDMQSRLGIDDDVLKEQMTFLALQGRSETQIRNTMQAAAELSKVMGIGLQQAVQYLDGTMEGNIGRLGRLDAAFTELTTAQLKNGAAVDLVNQKYGGLAEKSFEQGLGPLRRFQNAWGDLQKTLGGFLVNALMPVFNGLSRGMDNLNAVFDRFYTTSNQRFSDQVQKVAELETNITPLLDRYDQLATKSNLSTHEQTELSRIIGEITTALPSAATRFDEYGDAISISTDRVREFIDQQRAMMQYENRSAIKEVEKDVEKVNKQLAEIGPDIEAIEQTGTFQVFRRYFDQQTQEWVEGWRDASSQQVAETIKTNHELLFQRSGMIARLEELNGDALQKEIERRRQEAEANKEVIDKKQELTDSTEITRRAYVELSRAISQGREALTDFVTEQDYAKAEQQAAALQVLESQKAIIDKIILSGGSWESFMTQIRSDEFERMMKRNEDAVTSFLDAMKIDMDQDFEDLLNTLSDANDAQLEGFQKVGDKAKKIPEEWKDSWTEFAQIGSDATFDIIRQNQQASLNEKLSGLQRQRDAELENENLTTGQKEAIQEKYRKKEAKIKEDAFRKQKTADIAQAIINTALAVTKALSSAPPPANAILAALAGVAGAAQVAVIASQKVPQFAKGRYNVIGQDDNRLYRQVPFAGRATTGIYNRASLVAEKGDELIVDSPTLRNIRVNFPEVLRAIDIARVPQYATGRYPVNPEQVQPIIKHFPSEAAINKLMAAAQIFREASDSLRRDGVTGRWYLQDFDSINKIKTKIETHTKI